jgi:hypothetical protein
MKLLLKVPFSLILLFATMDGICQNTIPPVIRAQNTLERMSYSQSNFQPGDMMQGMARREADVEGSAYLFNQWKIGTLLVYNSEKPLENYLLQYDLIMDQFEFKIGSELKVLKGDKVMSFVTIDSATFHPSYFINGKDLKNSENLPVEGFLQVLSDGVMPLLKKIAVTVKNPDFNIALNVGNPDYKIIQNKVLYYQNGEYLHKVPGSKSGKMKIFEDKSDDIQRFVKTNKLDLQKEHHLIALFHYYNSLY